MFIDSMVAPVYALGPGKRLVIWTRGCSKHCKGCANPELWSTEGAKSRSVKDIYKLIENIYSECRFDGITFTGGDPLEQKDELLNLTESLRNFTDDILVYTGEVYRDMVDAWDTESLNRLRGSVAVLIDGQYVEELNTPDTVLRGSSNQNVIFFKEEYKPAYEAYMKEGRKIQNVLLGEKLISVGIHGRR